MSTPSLPRRVSGRGALAVAGQRIHVGIGHAGRTMDVEQADRTIRVYDPDGVLVVEVPCTTTKTIARFKVRRPEPPRSRLASRNTPVTPWSVPLLAWSVVRTENDERDLVRRAYDQPSCRYRRDDAQDGQYGLRLADSHRRLPAWTGRGHV